MALGVAGGVGVVGTSEDCACGSGGGSLSEGKDGGC